MEPCSMLINAAWPHITVAGQCLNLTGLPQFSRYRKNNTMKGL